MTLKKIGAAVLAVMLLLACLPFAASAANTPTILCVGEKDKSTDNLIDKYLSSGTVTVYQVFENTTTYYTLTREDGVGYVLTFSDKYTMSEMVENNKADCGLYCDGDLTVRIAGNVTFDANNKDFGDAYGWRVDGTLTIEGTKSSSKLTVIGNKTMRQNDDGGIGIYAETLKLDNVTVDACGGYAAVQAKSALVMYNAKLTANTDDSMKKNGKPQFAYSIETENFIQYGGFAKANGDVNIDAFYFTGGGTNEFEENVVVYGRSYTFAEESYSGSWSESFDLFRDPSLIPSCMQVNIGSTVAKLSGNRVTLNRRGSTSMTLYVVCGRDVIVFDTTSVKCAVQWWQWIPYILSGSWIEAVFH